MSLYVTKMISVPIRINPAHSARLRAFSESGFPRIAPTSMSVMCPPSRSGIGSRLNTPRLTVISPRNQRKFPSPSCATWYDDFTIPIGPASPFVDSCPRKSFLNMRSVICMNRVPSPSPVPTASPNG